MAEQHTPIPWRLVGGVTIIGPDGEPLAKVLMPIPSDAVREANAKFILLACNSHDALLESCKKVKAALNNELDKGWSGGQPAQLYYNLIALTDTAIANAKARTP